MPYQSEDLSDSQSVASTSSLSSLDEDEVNSRIAPCWTIYRHILHLRGFRLDTVRDVKEYYEQNAPCGDPEQLERDGLPSGYIRACCGQDDNALCKDAGLPDRLFRGTRISDGLKVVIKAVQLRSREFQVVQRLSSVPLRADPMNHCIPVLDLVTVSKDGIAFIVMEEWSPHFLSEAPWSLRLFLDTLRQCIEHIAFMHRHHMAHLDISLHNLVTDCEFHFAFIDYETSRLFDDSGPDPRLHGYKGTEMPPEAERGESCDPYKTDVWALGVLIGRACKLAGYVVPELTTLIQSMQRDNSDDRPSASACLRFFDSLLPSLGEDRLRMSSAIHLST